MENRIELQEPELVAMRPEERREAVRLLAALIRAARSPLRATGASSRNNGDNLAGPLPLAPGAGGKIASSERRGEGW
jgi:hypothetical protein